MATGAWSELELSASELATAAKDLANYCRQHDSQAGPGSESAQQDVADQVRRLRRTIRMNTFKIQLLVTEPTDFLQRMALGTQLTSSLQWLCEFQVLACIPLDGSVAYADVAGITGVPETQLCRVARMIMTTGFLCEPKPGHIAHSKLSRPFVKNPALYDAATFISGVTAPAALKMAAATTKHPGSQDPTQAPYNIAFDTSLTFASACVQRPKLQRRLDAFRHYTNEEGSGIRDVLMRLDWGSLGEATVVHVGARSSALATALTTLYPGLYFVVQTYDNDCPKLASAHGAWSPSSPGSTVSTPSVHQIGNPIDLGPRITVQERDMTTVQSVRNAAVYILQLTPTTPSSHDQSCIKPEDIKMVASHLEVLRDNPNCTLILIARVLPAPGTVDPRIEGTARLRDLSFIQLGNGREVEVSDVIEMLHGIKDANGGFVVANEIRTPNSPMIAFEVRYQLDASNQNDAPAVAII